MAPPRNVFLIGQSTSDLNFVTQLESKITVTVVEFGILDVKIKVNDYFFLIIFLDRKTNTTERIGLHLNAECEFNE